MAKSQDSHIDPRELPTVSNPTAAPPPGKPPIPDRVGDYAIVGLIASGGMGAVYEARQRSPQRRVALKVIRSERVSGSMLKRFEYESDVLGRLQHPGIAQIFEAGTFKSDLVFQPFFAMEYIDGHKLTEYAQREQFSARQKLVLIAMVCDAVHHAHLRGVIHRDLKPSNILVDRHGQPKVLDFGVARATDRDLNRTTATGAGDLIGTVPYMSPEQAAGETETLDIRSDVYALGVVAYELLGGQLPYDLEGKTWYQQVQTVIKTPPKPLSAVLPGAAKDIELILNKALAKEKPERYTSAEALSRDIRNFLLQKPIDARAPNPLYLLRKFCSRHRLAVAAAAIVVILAAGWWRRETQYREAERQSQLAEVRQLTRQNIELARTRGDWTTALSSYREALTQDHPDRTALRLGMIESMYALQQIDAVRSELERLEDQANLSGYEGPFLLLKAKTLEFDPATSAEAGQLRAKALEYELPDEQRAYAEAMLAKDPARREKLLNRAIQLDHLNFDARMYLGVELMLTGRKQEATEEFRVLAGLFPDAPEPLIFDGLLRSLDGEKGAIDRIKPQLAGLYDNMSLTAIAGAYEASRKMNTVLRRYDPVETTPDAIIREMMPVLFGLQGFLVQAQSTRMDLLRYVPEDMWQQALELRGVLDNPLSSESGDGFRTFIHAIVSYNTGDTEAALAQARRAATLPSLFDIRRPAVMLACVAASDLMFARGNAPDKQPDVQAMRRDLQTMLAEPGLSHMSYQLLGMLAYMVKDYELAFDALRNGLAGDQHSHAALVAMANTCLKLGFNSAAVDYARRATEKLPKHRKHLEKALRLCGRIGAEGESLDLDTYLRKHGLEDLDPRNVPVEQPEEQKAEESPQP